MRPQGLENAIKMIKAEFHSIKRSAMQLPESACSSKCSMSHCSMYSRPFSYPTLVCDFKMLRLLRILYFPARCFLCPYLIAQSDFFKPQVMLHSNSIAHAVIRATNAMIDKMSVELDTNHGTLVKVTPSTSGSSLPPAPSPDSPRANSAQTARMSYL